MPIFGTQHDERGKTAGKMENPFTHSELVSALRVLLDPCGSEEEQDRAFHRISRRTLDPQWSDYIFHSEEFVDGDGNVDLEAVAAAILAYQPMQL